MIDNRPLGKLHHPTAIHKTNTRYGEMSYYDEDPTIGRCLELYGEYTHVEILFMQYFTDVGSCVVDVGANIGTHTLGVCETVGHVIAIEPDPGNHKLLLKNTEGRENVTCMNIAISNCQGRTDTRFNYGKSKLRHGSTIPYTTIDMLDLPANLIKIDVEGMELPVLQGASNTIDTHRPILLVEMQDVTTYSKTFDYLKLKDYYMYWLPVSTYHAENFKGNTEDVFGPKHGVINWLCSATKLNTTLEAVVDNEDSVERMVWRRNQNVGDDLEHGE